jgi:hypothetical protein
MLEEGKKAPCSTAPVRTSWYSVAFRFFITILHGSGEQCALLGTQWLSVSSQFFVFLLYARTRMTTCAVRFYRNITPKDLLITHIKNMSALCLDSHYNTFCIHSFLSTPKGQAPSTSLQQVLLKVFGTKLKR